MSGSLSSASGIVILSVILSATGLLLKRKRPLFLTALAYVPPAVLLVVLDWSAPAWSWAFPYAFLLFILPVCLLYRGTLPEKLFAYLSQLAVACLAGWISTQAAQLVMPVPGEAYEAIRLFALLLTGGAYLYWMKARGQKLMREIIARETGWIWAVYAFGPCLGLVLLPMAFDPVKIQAPFFSGLLIVFILWSAAVLILAVLATHIKTQADFDLELARSIIDAGAAQAGEMAHMVETARILRHDCKHHLHVAQILLETGRIQEAREYLLAFGTKCDEGVLPVYCQNPAVNALLTGYKNRCRDEEIEFAAAVELPERAPMDSFELCTLLGNLLENALEACRKAKEGQRRIELRGAPQGGQLLITVTNTFDGTVLQEEDHIVSRKGAAGGLGIKSIRNIASRHQGEYIPHWEKNTFTASVMLRL